MFLSIRHKITLTFALLFILITAVLGIWLSGVFSRQYQDNLETSLKNDARLMAGFVDNTPQNSLAEFARRVGSELGVRVTILNYDGTPLAETNRPVEELENHLDRPEVQAALHGEIGVARRYSTTLGRDMLYVAAPFWDASGQVAGVLRLSRSLKEIQAATGRIRVLIFGAMLAGIAVALVLGGFITRAITQSLATLTRKSRDFGRGIFHNQKEIQTNDEIGELEQVFNDMAAQVVGAMARQDLERTRLEQILRNLPVGVLVIIDGGILLNANNAARDILGAMPDGENKPLTFLTRNRDVIQFVDSLLNAGGSISKEIVLEGDSGRKNIMMQGALVMSRDSSKQAEGVVVLQDVTALRLMEQQRKDLVANVSHELRTPLTAIQGFAETLLDEEVDEATARHFIKTIRQESLRLSRLINDLLNLSGMEGRGRRKHGITNLKEAVSKVAGLLGDFIKARGKELLADIPGDIQVEVAPDYVEQILVNYIDNALKYTPEGTRIRVETELQDNGFVRILVMDTGPGIPLHEQKRLFERFFRMEKSRGRDAGGTGLGLAIVKHIVEGFGGEVGVVSYPGSGTTFWATLPLKK